MKRIILDTNFLLIPVQFKVDIFEEIKRIVNLRYQLCIIDKSIDELEKIVTCNSKDKIAAKLALKIIKLKKIKEIKTAGKKHVDDLILNLVKKGHMVATQDKELKKKLKKKGIEVIILRQRKHLEIA